MKSVKVELDFLLSDHIGIGLYREKISPRRHFTMVNSALVKMLGFSSKKELLKFNIASFCKDLSKRDELFNILESEGSVKFYEMPLLKKDRSTIWGAISARAIKDINGKILFFEGAIEDITRHKQMDEELNNERELLQSLLDNIPNAIYFKDVKNRLVRVNRFHAQGLGLEPDEIIGKTDFDFFPSEQAQAMFEDDNWVLRTGKPIIAKIERTLLRNGTWNQVLTTKIPRFDRQGRAIGTMGITCDMTRYAQLENEKIKMAEDTVSALAKAMELRDLYTYGHAHGVALIAEAIAKEIGWDERRVLGLRMAGELHDVGKIAVPAEILTKPGKLTDLEYKIVQEHTQKCYDIIKDIKFPFPLAEAVYEHHERLDGSGYPQGLSGDKIIPEARILAVADVLEAMTLRRPYREALGIDKAAQELRKQAGKKFDAFLVDVVCRLIDRNKARPFWLNSNP